MILHLFNEQFRTGQSRRVVCIGPKDAIEGALPLDTLTANFGGHILYEDSDGDRYLGVWGARNASRFRRMLAERGVDFSLNAEPPQGARIVIKSVRTRPN